MIYSDSHSSRSEHDEPERVTSHKINLPNLSTHSSVQSFHSKTKADMGNFPSPQKHTTKKRTMAHLSSPAKSIGVMAQLHTATPPATLEMKAVKTSILCKSTPNLLTRSTLDSRGFGAALHCKSEPKFPPSSVDLLSMSYRKCTVLWCSQLITTATVLLLWWWCMHKGGVKWSVVSVGMYVAIYLQTRKIKLLFSRAREDFYRHRCE